MLKPLKVDLSAIRVCARGTPMFLRTVESVRSRCNLEIGSFAERCSNMALANPKLTSELEEQLKIMFDEIQVPFEKYSRLICPDRKNFLNYNYVLYKMCELLNKDEFLNCFPLLKDFGLIIGSLMFY